MYMYLNYLFFDSPLIRIVSLKTIVNLHLFKVQIFSFCGGQTVFLKLYNIHHLLYHIYCLMLLIN